MSLLLKNLRTLSILRHAYSTKRIDGLFAINNLRRELLIDINLPILSRRMASEAIKQIGVEELRNYQNNDKLIIDVREKDEIAETGVLPGGINIPLGDVANALSKTSEDFLKTYGKQKPEKNDTLIFSCRSGKRSSIAAQKAVELGYNNVINFKGGWLEWEKWVMFKNTYQSGILSIFYSCGSKPLSLWSKTVKSGYVKRLTDEQIQSLVLEIVGSNVVSTYISCPSDVTATLGIRLPILVMLVKNLKKYFSFEVQIQDDKNMKRRFRVSNCQMTAKIKPFITHLPLCLTAGWNLIQMNLAQFTKLAYNTQYVETTRIQINANCRLRRVYFTDKCYTDDELPLEYKLYIPVNKLEYHTQTVDDVETVQSELTAKS